jgi:hypothetical protein
MTTFYLDRHTCTQSQTQMKNDKQRGRERETSDKREGEIVKANCDGHLHNVLLSHIGRDRWIGPCGFIRIVDFKVLDYC